MSTALASTAALGAAALSGSWLLEVELVSTTELPFFGRAEVTTRSIALLDLRSEDGAVRARQTVCSIDVDSTAKAGRTTIPDAFVAALRPQDLSVTFDADSVHLDGGREHVGLPPDYQGELPRAARHEAVVDQDGDGKPGMTVQLTVPVFGAVEVYVVQRAHTVLHGTRQPDGTVAGEAQIVELDQRTIGASNPFFKVSNEVTPLPAKSRFTMRPHPSRCP